MRAASFEPAKNTGAAVPCEALSSARRAPGGCANRLQSRSIAVWIVGYMTAGSAMLPTLTQELRQRCVNLCPEGAQVGTISKPATAKQKTPNRLSGKGVGVDWHAPTQVDRGGIEPPTHGFSVRCSTN